MGDSQITEEKAEYGLHIRHIHRLYHARYGYKGYSRNRCANHSESNDVPWRLVFSFKKRCIRTSFPSGDTGYQQENGKVAYNSGKYHHNERKGNTYFANDDC